jgi:hypothetical protein
LYKINSFHKLESNSEITGKLKDVKLTELKIPKNDILTLRKGNKEIYISFNNMEIFL